MKINKEFTLKIPGVYATTELVFNGKQYLAAASENRDGYAYIIDPIKHQYSRLWTEKESGVMNIIQEPGKKRLFAITSFFPIFQSKEASICSLIPSTDDVMTPWKIVNIFTLPYCHRIGSITVDNKNYLIACTVCRDKDFQEDWSKPGEVWISPIPENHPGEWSFKKIYGGLIKNHGLFIEKNNQVYITSEKGVMLFDFSKYIFGQEILPTIITSTPTSDVFGTSGGEKSWLGTIEPFHGEIAKIYEITNDFREIRSYPIHFGHVVWIGEILNKKAILLGSRGEHRNLVLIFWESGEEFVIDKETGSTQVTVFKDKDSVKIFSANHYKDEVSMYSIS